MYPKSTVDRMYLPRLPVLALLLWFRLGLQVRDLAGLVAAGLATVVLFAVVSVLYVYRDDPFVDLRTQLVRLAARRSRA